MIEVEDSVVINERKYIMSKKSQNAGEINERVRKLTIQLQGVITVMAESDVNLRLALTSASQTLQGSETCNIQDLKNPIDSARSLCRGTQNKTHDAWRALNGWKA